MEKQVKLAIVGCGHRGEVYASFSLKHPKLMKFDAVVDPNTIRMNYLGDLFNVKKENRFTSLEGFLNSNLKLDGVINSTMDKLHHKTAMAILKAGYNMLIEKPISLNNQIC